MAEELLVGPDIETGRLFVDQLIREGFPLKAAAWVYESENQRWRLYLVAPIRNRDLLDFYLRASQAALADPDRKEDFKLVSFTIVDSRQPLGRRLVGWAKSTKRDYRKISDSAEGQLISAVVYGAAA
jgi:hypothetical protein